MRAGEPHLALDYARQMGGAIELYTILRDLALREVPPPDILQLYSDRVICAVANYGRLAALLGASESTVKRYLQRLLGEGWIIRVERRPLSTAYILEDDSGNYAARVVRKKSRKPLKKRIPGRKKGLPSTPEIQSGHELVQSDPDFNGPNADPIKLSGAVATLCKKAGIEESLFYSLFNLTSIYKREKETGERIESKISPSGKRRRRERKKPLVKDWKNRDPIEWRGMTVWTMIRDKLHELGIGVSFLQEDYTKNMKLLNGLLKTRGPAEVKKAAEFFCKHYRALRSKLGFKGNPTPATFAWFYNDIRDASEGKLNLHTYDRAYEEGGEIPGREL